MARKEQLLAALDIKSEEEKKLKKLQEDIHAQNTILFDMQVQVKEVIFNNSRGFLHAIFRWSLICTSKFVQVKENVQKFENAMQYQWNPSETSLG